MCLLIAAFLIFGWPGLVIAGLVMLVDALGRKK